MTEPLGVSSLTDGRHAHLLDSASLNKISWSAVLAGVAVALSTQILMTLLGLGIGTAVLDPAASDNPGAGALSISSGLWFVASGVIASFVGGYIASYLSARPNRSTGVYHGLTSWAVTTLLVLYLLTTSLGAIAGGAVGGIAKIIGGFGQTATSVATAAAPAVAGADNPFSGIEQRIRTATGNDPQALQDTAVAALRAVISGDQATTEDARSKAATALARAQNIPADQAKAQVMEYEAQYKQSVEVAKQKALAAAQTAAKALSTGAIIAFLALLLGAVAAWFGGLVGTVRAETRVCR